MVPTRALVGAVAGVVAYASFSDAPESAPSAVASSVSPEETTSPLGLRIGDTDLGLVAKANPGTGAAPRILLSIGVDDVDETLGRVEALGGSVRGGPNDMPWGQRVAHIQDPDGNPVNFTQPIPAR
ncbi:hypothetical protein GCM10022206_17960 [Streptomyces chiangmaiensis]